MAATEIKIILSKPEGEEKEQLKKKRRNKTDLGPNFIAPDGGWGWVVCLAAGISNFSTFPVIQQFGLIFRDQLLHLGLTTAQITALFNTNSAISSCTGLLNGPMFRRFTFRQVGVVGSILVTIGLFCASFCNSFITYLITFSLLYGCGLGISMSAASLAVNTYFKTKRRIATGIQWTVTGLGPIVMPYLATYLLPEYGVLGCVIIFSGIAFHALPSALVYQPVLLHIQKADKINTDEEPAREFNHMCQYCRMSNRKSTSIFSSQYLYNSDDKNATGYEITDPGTPMLSRANDGWFSNSSQAQKISQNLTIPKHTYNVKNHIEGSGDTETNKDTSEIFTSAFNSNSNTFKREKERSILNLGSLRNFSGNEEIQKCTCAEARELLTEAQKPATKKELYDKDSHENYKKNLSFLQKVVIFFDLDLFKDFTYVNLMLGLTTGNFAELNYSILTPFVLRDFGFSQSQIAILMSLLAGTDVGLRFIIPFIAEKIGLQNKTFYVIGIVAMALGRIVIAHVRIYEVVLVVSAWIGLGKALRTIFMALVIPSHVPLERLPAASGLQLLFAGIFTLCMGPIIGWIRDTTNYTITLHCLNIATFWTAISWGLESLYHMRRQKQENIKVQL